MPRRSLVLTAFLFLGLLALTWWVRRKPAMPEPAPFFALKKRTPDTLVLAFAGDTTVMVPRGKTGWQVVSPIDYPADGLLVEAALKRLQKLDVEKVYPLTERKLDSFGFRSPRGMIRAVYTDGQAADTLFVGAFTPNGAYDYVRNGSADAVAILDSRIARSYFLKETRELRDTRLLPFSETRVKRLELLGPGDAVRVSVERNADGEWRVTEPHPGPADGTETGEYLSSLNHMHIRDFVPGGETLWAARGLRDPPVGARVTTEDGEVVGVYLGGPGPDDEVYARGFVHPQVFLVSNKYVGVLGESADRFRKASVVTFGLNEVDSVRVVSGEGSRVFDVKPPGDTHAPSPARDVLGNWLLLRAEAFEPAEAARLRHRGLAPPAGRMLWFGGADTLATVDVGTADADHLPVRVVTGAEARREEILLLPAKQAGPLWSYLERRVGGE